MKHRHVDPTTLNLGQTVADIGPAATRWPMIAATIGLLGAIVVAIARMFLIEGEDTLNRFMFSYMHNFLYFLSLAVGALFFVMMHHLARAGWSVTVRRLMEVMAATLCPTFAIMFLPILVCVWLQNGLLFAWTSPEFLAEHPLVADKTGYLNATFFTARAILYFAVWGYLSRSFLRDSIRQDEGGSPEISKRLEGRSAWGTLVTFLTVTFASFDWAMSLDPAWFSTMFGVYFIAGSLVSLFAVMWVIVYACQAAGVLTEAVTVEHQHDIGKYLFGFVIFWSYITFCQYLLYWYGDIPEETHWYWVRQHNGWGWIGISLILGHFAIPFLGLLSRSMKRNRNTLLFWSVWILVMHWIDLYFIIMPIVSPGALPFGAIDVLMFVGLGGLATAGMVRAAGSHALVPTRDPRLVESLVFENV